MEMKTKSKSKSKLRPQSRTDERWTAKTWDALARHYFAMAGDLNLPRELRAKFDAEAEAAWVTSDLLRGITPEMREEITRKEDGAFAAWISGGKTRQSPSQLAEEKREEKLALYSVRNRQKKKPTKSKANKSRWASQLELELA